MMEFDATGAQYIRLCISTKTKKKRKRRKKEEQQNRQNKYKSTIDNARYTRSGNAISLLDSFVEYLPSTHTDGEFWYVFIALFFFNFCFVFSILSRHLFLIFISGLGEALFHIPMPCTMDLTNLFNGIL